MNVAFGLKAHSGWAALVSLGSQSGEFIVADRRRVELVETNDASWAKQPYHAAEELNAVDARTLVKRAIESARSIAMREIRVALKRAQSNGHEVVGCAVLIGEPMPKWTVAEILAVHIRMHKAEGALFRDVLALAAEKCGVRFIGVSEKQLEQVAVQSLATPITKLRMTIAELGKSIGPPWGKDQKDATLAAMIALLGDVK